MKILPESSHRRRWPAQGGDGTSRLAKIRTGLLTDGGSIPVMADRLFLIQVFFRGSGSPDKRAELGQTSGLC